MPDLSWVIEIINRFTLKALIREILKIKEETRVGNAKKSIQQHIQLLCSGSWQGPLRTALLATSPPCAHFTPGKWPPLSHLQWTCCPSSVSFLSSLCLQGQFRLPCRQQTLLAFLGESGLGRTIRPRGREPSSPRSFHPAPLLWWHQAMEPLIGGRLMEGVSPLSPPWEGARQSSQWGLQYFPLPDGNQCGPPVSQACPQPSTCLQNTGDPSNRCAWLGQEMAHVMSCYINSIRTTKSYMLTTTCLFLLFQRRSFFYTR